MTPDDGPHMNVTLGRFGPVVEITGADFLAADALERQKARAESRVRLLKRALDDACHDFRCDQRDATPDEITAEINQRILLGESIVLMADGLAKSIRALGLNGDCSPQEDSRRLAVEALFTHYADYELADGIAKASALHMLEVMA